MRYLLFLTLAACNTHEPPKPSQPESAPAPAPPEAPPLAPVQPGQYTNHIGDPTAGHWDSNGQWVWNNPESKEANSTMSYLAAAGLGAAGGAALSHYMTRKSFEQNNPSGQWNETANRREVTTYLDRHGQPISKDEYERRRAQSERDRKAYYERQKAQLKAEREQLDRDKKSFEAKKNAPSAPAPLKQSGGTHHQQSRQKIRWKPKSRR